MKKINALSLLVALMSSLLLIVLYYKNLSFLEELEGNALSLMFDIRGGKTPDQDIAIVAIDEKSLQQLGRWPWSRKVWAEFVTAADRYEPALLAFDVWFSEKESGDADELLAEAFRRSGRIILPMVFEIGESNSHADIAHWSLSEESVDGAGYYMEGRGVIASLPEFNASVMGCGHINVSLDDDGTIRWTPLIIRYENKFYPSLALAASRQILSPHALEVAGGDSVKVGERTILTDEMNRMLINYAGGEKTYPYHSFVDVLEGRVERGLLQKKLLLVGATAQGIYDMRVTPLSSNIPGVEVNANILDNILNGTYLTRRPLHGLFDLSGILLSGILFGLIIPRVRAALAFPFALTTMLGYASLSFFFFTRGHWISAVYPILAMTLAYLSSTAVRLFAGEKRIGEIRRIFSNYVSRKVVDELIRNPEKANLGGQIKELTIIFCDLKGFTSYSERHSPKEIVSILNEYFAAMTDCILKYDGTLDKFLGDGIMAFWNAPLDQPDHPELAVNCALEMCERFGSLRKKWRDESKEVLDVGIGIHVGEVVIGNIGVSGKKMEYTAIGDNVNITYRIQDQTRIYGHKIIITKTFFDRIAHLADAREIGPVTLKGKREPVVLFSLEGVRRT